MYIILYSKYSKKKHKSPSWKNCSQHQIRCWLLQRSLHNIIISNWKLNQILYYNNSKGWLNKPNSGSTLALCFERQVHLECSWTYSPMKIWSTEFSWENFFKKKIIEERKRECYRINQSHPKVNFSSL